MSNLAIKGGKKIRKEPFPPYVLMTEVEAKIAYDVVKSGVLSKFLGCWDPDFFGGTEVQALEREWEKFFNVKHAITVNSNTSGIICSLGALEIGPGDEVIVSPYSMSISASAPLFYGAIPVFVDIEEEYFCLDPKKVEAAITPRTKAIIAVDIFGSPYDVEAIRAISKKYNIPIIEDCAQAPFAQLDGEYAGAFGDIGVFSLNYHKHIHSGEGGVICTNDDDLAMRCRLIRNHAEAVVDGAGFTENLVNLIGFNFRMTEIEAGIARSLLKKLPGLVEERIKNVHLLESKIKNIPFLSMPKVRRNSVHAYYVHGMKFNKDLAGISRETFVDAVKAELAPAEGRLDEGVLMNCGYVRPLYLQSLYQKKIGFGKLNYPFSSPANKSEMNYSKGICPVAEKMHYHEFFSHELMRPGMSEQDMLDVANAFLKVAENINELK